MTQGARIYNLFPRLLGSMKNWTSHFDRIKNMHFDWVYINPIQYPGFSGSLYSLKDYYAYNPLFLDNNSELSAEEQVKNMLSEAHAHGLHVIMDLVINHTAIDSVLIEEHADWYMKNDDGSIKNPGCIGENGEWLTWGDLAQIDNSNSSDRDGLWKYWLEMVEYCIKLGFDGFRCDAAYHVPQELWVYLIENVKRKNPSIKFFGETLGCTAEETIRVAEAGFDYVFNSSKWWNFHEEWFLREYKKVAGCAPSISFPESHDTERTAETSNGNEHYSKIRYAFSALFSTGVMIPIGYEYGFKNHVDVCTTYPDNWEEPNFDISNFIKSINDIKSSYKVFNEDNIIELVNSNNDSVFAFTKYSVDKSQKALVIINKDTYNYQGAWFNDIYSYMDNKLIEDVSPTNRMEFIPKVYEYFLAPGEIRVLVTK